MTRAGLHFRHWHLSSLVRLFSVSAVVFLTLSFSERKPSNCAPDNAGLELPEGFCAQIVADLLGKVRHVTVGPNGDIYVAARTGTGNPGVIALRDTDGDGDADITQTFGSDGGSEVLYFEKHLYFASPRMVIRWSLDDTSLVPSTPPDTIVSGLLAYGQHGAKTFALGKDRAIYVNISAPSNTCQMKDRTLESPGLDPCPWLDSAGGIWRFEIDRLRQRQRDGERWATGIRNIMALSMAPDGVTLFGVQHGRDNLQSDWPKLHSTKRAVEAPKEEFFRLEKEGDYGWPYCYFDAVLKKKILNPEYGGDGKTAGRCAAARQPEMTFPAHWAPNSLLFYTGTSFPEKYRQGAFVAFHGSFNRAPLEQEGFNVVFVPFYDGRPSEDYEIFADGFRGAKDQMRHRPTGLALAPDGSLIVSDDAGGRIYRIRYNAPLSLLPESGFLRRNAKPRSANRVTSFSSGSPEAR
ncbi:MAG: sorbosone dehydrogenase family protein [Gemmatimonadaceae bacterium]